MANKKRSAEEEFDMLMGLKGADIANTVVLAELIRTLREKGVLTDGEIDALLRSAETQARSSEKRSALLVQYIQRGVRLFRELIASAPGGVAVH